MANTPESISHIRIGETEFPIDAVTVQGKSLPDENSLLPIVSSADEDKILMVLQGQWGMYNPGDLYDLINGIPCGDSSYIPDWGDSESEGPIDYPNEYLTFEVLTPGDIIWKEHGSTAKTIQYSKNGGEWITITSTASPRTIPVVAGDLVRFKGTNTSYAISNTSYSGFGDADYATATYNVYGNIMSLIYGDNFQNQTVISDAYAFCCLFDTSSVVSAENLILPATTMTEHCYRALFANCVNMTIAPALPATTLANNCYRYMFNMDENLVTAPELLATTLAQESYYGMFNGCTSLHYIKCLATDISAQNCLKNWTNALPHSGEFVKDINMYDFTVGSIDGIPIGWTVTETGTAIVDDPIIEYINNTIYIYCETPNSYVYYRLNQTGQFTVYINPIEISEDTIVEAYSSKAGSVSNTVTGTYIYVEPEDTGDSESEIPEHDYSLDYLTLDVLTPGYLLWKAYGNKTMTIDYSINDGEWTSATSTSSGLRIQVSQGDKVRVKGSNATYATSKSAYSGFDAGTATFDVYGNTMSLIYGDNYIGQTTLTGTYTFCSFFKLSNVINAEHMILPATHMANYSYRAMFSKCSSLATAPALPATTLTQGCYWYMFEDCAITTAPDLLADTLPAESYGYMFTGCNNLSYIRCLATTKSASKCLEGWVTSVAPVGVFVKDENTTWAVGVSGIPTGWVVNDDIPEPEPEEEYEGPTPALLTWSYNNNDIQLPYSVNAIDGHSGSYARGTFTFSNKIALDDVQQPTYLWFDHADQSADIYIDGSKVTTHWGGYNSFTTDITNYVHSGLNNLSVVLNNSSRNTLAPAAGDFNFNATLGDVKLITAPVLPGTQYGYDGFHVQSTVTASSADLAITTSVNKIATVNLTIDDGTYHYTDTITSNGTITFNVTITNPHLWNGTLDPHLYDITIDFYDGNTLCHSYTRPYGLRYFSYVYNDTSVLQSGDPYTGFLLNGSPYLLRGVCMHQDLEGKANALTLADITHDFSIISELGANFIRTAHYPHPKAFYDKCDELGIIVQTEVPCVNKFNSTQTSDYYTHLEGQYTDMVNEHYNHPSIIFWGLGNEITTDDTSWAKTKLESYRTLIRTLDPSRWVGYVMSHSNRNGLGAMGYPTMDWIGQNLYVGWYLDPTSNNPTSRLNECLNYANAQSTPMAYSEYGCGGTTNCHSDTPETTTTKGTNKPRHDIEYQMWLHEGQIAAIKNKPELLFSAQWVLFDFAVSSRQEGYTICLDGENTSTDDSLKYLNNKGLVERDHVTKKDTFYLYKAWWNPTSKFVHICQKNYQKIADRVIKCYTNDGTSLSLYVNGTLVETTTVTDNIASFTARTFIYGDVIRVVGASTEDTFIIAF